MDAQTLIDYSHRLNTLCERYGDLLSNQLESLRREHGIDPPHQLSQALDSLTTRERLLNIGFVGRVKAGKSSLLNALFFDGRAVLPKAATPMTAALTTLSYGEQFCAEVECFSDEDIELIQTLARQYDQQLAERQTRLQTELLKRFEQSGRPVQPDEIRRQAERQAKMQMSEIPALAAAKEQAVLMADGRAPGQRGQRLEASSPEQLVELLQHYVSASGAHTPFTKIVHVFMPLPALRDIRVIDTPGTNDPVLSREERTIALLKECDVVFVVSPAGQFLDHSDQALLNRITVKEGVQELVLIASQVDSQLHDSEKRARLDDALLNISQNLGKRADGQLRQLMGNAPEAREVFEALLRSAQDGVIHSAGICLTLENSLSLPLEQWGDDEQTAWTNLVESYPDYFDLANPQASLVSLAKVSNIAPIRQRLEQVRARKHEIAQAKVALLLERKQDSLRLFEQALARWVTTQIALVTTTDIGQLRQQLEALQARQENLAYEVGLVYERCRQDYLARLERELIGDLKQATLASEQRIEQAYEHTLKQTLVNKSGALNWVARKLWDGGRRAEQSQELQVATAQIHSALDGFILSMEGLLTRVSGGARAGLDKALGEHLAPAMHRVLGEDSDANLIARAIRETVQSLDSTSLDLGLSVPRELRPQGTLNGRPAEDYLDTARDFAEALPNTMTRKFRSYQSRLKASLDVDIARPLVQALTAQINALNEQTSNAAQTLERLNLLQRELRD